MCNLHAILPQTQCRECGYPDCKSYATALTQNEKNIGLCAPGGLETLDAIAAVLKRDPEPYREEANARYREPAQVIIREEECIGCTKCIQACPVDAIIGTAKQMHTVLTNECTGCGLCIPPCPVDCIEWIPLKKPAYNPTFALQRYNAKNARLQAAEQQAKKSFQETLARIKAKHHNT